MNKIKYFYYKFNSFFAKHLSRTLNFSIFAHNMKSEKLRAYDINQILDWCFYEKFDFLFFFFLVVKIPKNFNLYYICVYCIRRFFVRSVIRRRKCYFFKRGVDVLFLEFRCCTLNVYDEIAIVLKVSVWNHIHSKLWKVE